LFVNLIDKLNIRTFTCKMPSVYLDCNATTPLDPAVREVFLRYIDVEYGNEGSRTHEFGARAKAAVQKARDHVAKLVDCQREEVLFTSGATESNNLAILGLQEYAVKSGKRHIITTGIEHKAVLEPIEALKKRGFEVTIVPSSESGTISVSDVVSQLRPDTCLVSVMHVNNETGAIQPIEDLCNQLAGHEAYLHMDAAQGFGKCSEGMLNKRVDLISVSGHKIYAPKGIGALIARRRGISKTPLNPILFGGGQERGLRPGTLPVALIAALGEAANQAILNGSKRRQICEEIKAEALKALGQAGGIPVGDQARVLPNTLNMRFPKIDSEAMIVALQGIAAVSNGSACTSSSYKPSHVLKAMGFDDMQSTRCVRFSWCHLTPEVEWNSIRDKISSLGIN